MQCERCLAIDITSDDICLRCGGCDYCCHCDPDDDIDDDDGGFDDDSNLVVA